jgi:hypothetical protein
MPSVPTIRTFVAGEVVLAGYFNNNIGAPLAYLLAPPIFQGRQTSAQAALTTGVFTAILFDTEDIDSANGHSTSSNTSRYNAQYTGWYQQSGGMTFAANATGRRLNRTVVNTSTVIAGSLSGIPGNASLIGYALRPVDIFLNGGFDFVETFGFQDSGAGLAPFVANPEYQPSFNLKWISN